jgi:hypothetical protein
LTAYQIPPNGPDYGVNLDMLIALLNETNLKASRNYFGAKVQHEHFTTSIRILPPPPSDAEPLQAVVLIESEIPSAMWPYMDEADSGVAFNALASLGALRKTERGYLVESRLSIFVGENAWGMHCQLLMYTVIVSAEAILGGIRRSLKGEEPARDNRSRWTERDIEQVEKHLSQLSFCNASGLILTAEFALEPGAVSAVNGDKTALFQMSAKDPHPEAGGGLFCMLQLPYTFQSKEQVNSLAATLNGLEMVPADQPPHFGAWCVGKSGLNLAYVSFLPNALHAVPGIAVNFTNWAMYRAEWADAAILRLMEPPKAAPEAPVRQNAAPQPAPALPKTAAQNKFAERMRLVALARSVLRADLPDNALFDIASQLLQELLAPAVKKDIYRKDEVIQSIRHKYPSVLYSEVERLIAVLAQK